MMWTQEKESRYHELAQRVSDTINFGGKVDTSLMTQASQLGNERDEWIAQQLEKQGPTRERDINDREYLQLMAEKVSAMLPDAHGFIVFAFPFQGGRMRYVSNCNREDAVRALKTWLIQASGEEEWMTHIK